MLVSKVFFYNRNKNLIGTEIVVIEKHDYTSILEAEEKIKEYAIERCKEYLDARDLNRRIVTYDYIVFEPDVVLQKDEEYER